jgi:hypothetical protein
MGRNAHANYIDAAMAVLQELGGGPISTKTLVAAAQERGLVGNGTWVYHNFSRKVRESDLFDTSVRGQISLVQNFEPMVEEPVMVVPIEDTVEEEAFVAEPEEETVFPGPTLGGGFAG